MWTPEGWMVRPRLAEPEGHVGRREPQVALGELARLILGARGWVSRLEQRPQLLNPLEEHRLPALPADPLHDHR